MNEVWWHMPDRPANATLGDLWREPSTGTTLVLTGGGWKPVQRIEIMMDQFGTQDQAEAWAERMIAEGWHSYSISQANPPSIQVSVKRVMH